MDKLIVLLNPTEDSLRHGVRSLPTSLSWTPWCTLSPSRMPLQRVQTGLLWGWSVRSWILALRFLSRSSRRRQSLKRALCWTYLQMKMRYTYTPHTHTKRICLADLTVISDDPASVINGKTHKISGFDRVSEEPGNKSFGAVSLHIIPIYLSYKRVHLKEDVNMGMVVRK